MMLNDYITTIVAASTVGFMVGFIATLADHDFDWRESVMLGVLMAVAFTGVAVGISAVLAFTT